jgi:hypothetical protein
MKRSASSEPQAATITATAPCRVDLAGGTVDIWPLYLFHPGAVTVNVAVDIRARCRIAPSRSSEIHLSSVDTGLEDRFPGFEALHQTAPHPPRHALAAHLLRFFSSGRASEGRALAGNQIGGARRRRHLRFLGADDSHHGGVGPIPGPRAYARTDP